MFRALPLAIGDLADPRVLRLLARSLAVTLLLFVAIGAVLAFALNGFDPCDVFGDDSCPIGFGTSGFAAFLLTAILLWFLFPVVAIGVISAFMDQIVAAVEARHYPEALAHARPLGMVRGAWLGLRSSLRVALYNLVALPFYILFLVTGVGTVLLFMVVNGAAFGRDLGEMVAVRHLDRAGCRAWLAGSRGERTLVGIVVTGIFLVPFVNLLAPVLGAAMATHLFHQRRYP